MITEKNVEPPKALINRVVIFKVLFISFLFWLISIGIFIFNGDEILIFFGGATIFLPCMIGISVLMLLMISIFKKEVTNKQLFYYSILCLAIITVFLLLLYLTDNYEPVEGGGNSGYFG